MCLWIVLYVICKHINIDCVLEFVEILRELGMLVTPKSFAKQAVSPVGILFAR